MAEIKKNYISLVAVGRPNPQILNVDFLKANNIVPVKEPPFVTLLQQEKPFTRFISTPVMSNLVMANIEFMVDEGRFQIRDIAISDWAETKIFDIARKYFEVLPYTPLTLIGLNFNTTIVFSTSEEAVNFQSLFLPENSKVLSILARDNVNAGVVLRYSCNSVEQVLLTISQSNKENSSRTINFNYEFKFTNWLNFNTELTKISKVGTDFDSILSQLLGEI